MLVAILSIALVAFTPGGIAPSSAPAVLGGGGPDTYGYKYLDSDTTGSGAPTYNWVSIKGVGTEITTLLDDNTAGPFSVGFNFPYYWYNVNSVIVGSNGYITFGDATANASPFKAVPSTQKPNNQLAMLLSDLDCTTGASPNGSIWYWSNGADSFIVEYDSIAFWSTGGNNTFQVILTKADSSITFQYKEQSGAPYQGWGATNNQTGIENISGAIGLNYLSGATPSGNLLHPDLAVRFFPPDSSTLQIHDVGIRNAMNDRSGGLFAVNGRPLSFWAVVKNYGNQSEAAYQTHFKVTRQNNAVVFSDSMMTMASAPGETESLALGSTWRPVTNGTYILKIYTRLAGDMLAANDTVKLELRVVTMPALLSYDGGTPGSMWYFYSAGGGWGNRFVPPVYPCSVQSARVYLGMRSVPSSPYIAIFDDNGPAGTPGDTLYKATVNVAGDSWFTVTPSSPVVIGEGAFFVAAISVADSEPTFGMDSVPPLSFQKWEHFGGWSLDRDAGVRDFMANATISGPVGIFESVEPTPAPAPARIDVSPSPFRGLTTLRLLNPTGAEKAIELYDATGSVVRTLVLSRDRAILDGRQLADGVYFARVAEAEAPVAKVIVTH
ncbi:T9SS type A sorting domain-containing protein [candidate division WOR-3 bacterium]|uniref:T9SS type A sorting domain-containing protein n=1 Tax=candidate division WOR-3 bacterium TaxID=2052148 RepID=A0A937XDZ3_UNCW3|nr:T9SS type A sorting domain-containing protein [candidate division WOR-3 bacterium]